MKTIKEMMEENDYIEIDYDTKCTLRGSEYAIVTDLDNKIYYFKKKPEPKNKKLINRFTKEFKLYRTNKFGQLLLTERDQEFIKSVAKIIEENQE